MIRIIMKDGTIRLSKDAEMFDVGDGLVIFRNIREQWLGAINIDLIAEIERQETTEEKQRSSTRS